MTSTIADKWTIKLKALPAYVAFKGDFCEELDADFIKFMLEDDRWRPDLRDMLVKFSNRLNAKGQNVIKHYQPKGLGRFYAEGDESIINLPRQMKHTMMKHLGWVDWDLKKSHPSICVEVGKMSGHRFLGVENYIDNYDRIIASGLDYYSTLESPLDKDDIKEFFNAGLNGQEFRGWIYNIENSKHNPKPVKRKDILPEWKEYLDDCKQITDLIMLNNPEMIAKLKGDLTEDTKIRNRMVSYWCGAFENDIIHTIYKYLVSQDVIKQRCCSPEYDGLCFKPAKKEINYTELEADINAVIKQKTGMEVKGKFKGYEKVCDDLIERFNAKKTAVPAPDDLREEYERAECYVDFKKAFEVAHCKIVNKSAFLKIIKETDGSVKECKWFSKNELTTSYEHLTYEKGKDIGHFIKDWLNDKTIRIYQDVDIVPPPLVCPSNILNLWFPFRIQHMEAELWAKYPYLVKNEENEADIHPELQDLLTKSQRLTEHIYILCNQNEEHSDFLLRWIGQMLKYPAHKTFMPTLISKEGAGKGTLIKMLSKILGKNRILETADPKMCVWGTFNELMLNAYLVSLNEMCAKDAAEAIGKIKMLIKDENLIVNPKGKGHIKTSSYHRFMGSSNNTIPVRSEEDDRRNFILRCSDQLIVKNADGTTNEENRKYFQEINDLINDDQVMYVWYSCLCSLPNLDTFHTLQPPTTEYQRLIQSGNVSPIDEWIVQFTRDNWYSKEVVISSKDMTARFKEWRDSHNLRYDCDSAKLSRAIGIAMINFPQETRKVAHSGKKGNFAVFNIENMKKHLKLNEDNAPLALVLSEDECETENEYEVEEIEDA